MAFVSDADAGKAQSGKDIVHESGPGKLDTSTLKRKGDDWNKHGNEKNGWDYQITWVTLIVAVLYSTACCMIFDRGLSPASGNSNLYSEWTTQRLLYWIVHTSVLGAIGLLLGNVVALIFMRSNSKENYRLARNVIAIIVLVLGTGAIQWNKNLTLIKPPPTKGSYDKESQLLRAAQETVTGNLPPTDVANMEKKIGNWTDEDAEQFYRYRAKASDNPVTAKAAYENRVIKIYAERLNIVPPVFRELGVAVHAMRRNLTSLVVRPFSDKIANQLLNDANIVDKTYR
jgi:hypothetical protein